MAQLTIDRGIVMVWGGETMLKGDVSTVTRLTEEIKEAAARAETEEDLREVMEKGLEANLSEFALLQGKLIGAARRLLALSRR